MHKDHAEFYLQKIYFYSFLLPTITHWPRCNASIDKCINKMQNFMSIEQFFKLVSKRSMTRLVNWLELIVFNTKYCTYTYIGRSTTLSWLVLIKVLFNQFKNILFRQRSSEFIAKCIGNTETSLLSVLKLCCWGCNSHRRRIEGLYRM